MYEDFLFDMHTVKAHLIQFYGKRQALAPFNFWVLLAVFGHSEVRSFYSKSSFYKNRNKLIDAGIYPGLMSPQ
jgi:hypothetical protein